MRNDTEQAKALLTEGAYTAVLKKGGTTYTSKERGVLPLVTWVSEGTDFRGFSAADVVVGKAAALLYVLMGVSEVYGALISEKAVETLCSNGISVLYEKKTERIMNRAKNGFCPMETAVMDIDSAEEAFEAITRTMEALRARN